MNMDLNAFAEAYQASFQAQIALFPAMMSPEVQKYIDAYRDKALAWKMAGAGGGGYLALVYDGERPANAIPITIRRRSLY
jgi:galactokinase/mevalonate kinase-like predicted kinase